LALSWAFLTRGGLMTELEADSSGQLVLVNNLSIKYSLRRQYYWSPDLFPWPSKKINLLFQKMSPPRRAALT
jgi:hypothetical protein